MGRALRALGTTLFFLAFVVSAVAGPSGSKLSKEDRRWLEQVAPLITPEEADLFREIDALDRERFRRIFWARRDPDPDPRTPRNELQEEFRARRTFADREFRQAGLSGAATDMGKVFLLLGPPSRVAQGRVEDSGRAAEDEECNVCDVELESSLIMKVGPTAGLEEAKSVTWVYGREPLLGIPRGLTVEFRSQSTLGYRLVRSRGVEAALERARRLGVCRALGFERDRAGRLAAVDDAAENDDTLARTLTSPADPTPGAPGVSFRATPVFLGSDDGGAYVPVDLEIEPDSLTWADDQVAEVTLSGLVAEADADAGPSNVFRVRAALALDTEGRVRFDIPVPLPPGRRELRLAIRDDASGRVGAEVLDLVVPDFHSGSLVMSGIVTYAEAWEVEPAPRRAGHAFEFGGLRVTPESSFRRDEKMGVLFFVYGLGSSRGPAPVVRYAFFQEGDLAGQTAETSLPVADSRAVGNTEIPLGGLAPGRYTLVVAVTDTTNDTMLTRSVDIELEDVAP